MLSTFKKHRSLFVAGTVLTVSLVAGMIAVVKWLDSPPPQTQKVVQQISLVRPPPPPPPPDEPPPPPEMEEEEVDIPEPADIPEPSPMDEPPPGDLLGLDADGAAGVDGFGLVARKGGRDLLASGGSRYRWYAGILKQSLLEQLSEIERVRSQRYEIVVRLWLSPDGSVRDVKLVGSTGSRDLDDELRAALARIDNVGETPPADLPQPVQLQIVSRL